MGPEKGTAWPGPSGLHPRRASAPLSRCETRHDESSMKPAEGGLLPRAMGHVLRL